MNAELYSLLITAIASLIAYLKERTRRERAEKEVVALSTTISITKQLNSQNNAASQQITNSITNNNIIVSQQGARELLTGASTVTATTNAIDKVTSAPPIALAFYENLINKSIGELLAEYEEAESKKQARIRVLKKKEER